MLISNTLKAKNERPGCSLDPKIKARLGREHLQMQTRTTKNALSVPFDFTYFSFAVERCLFIKRDLC